MTGNEHWPALPVDRWQPTRDTLHLWTQIVGKVRLTLAPWTNHSWHVPLHVNGTGLTTSLMPYADLGVEIAFDFVEHRLVIVTTAGQRRTLELALRSVADFYAEFGAAMHELGVDVPINPMPAEIADAIPFPDDHVHADYDGAAAHAFWLSLVQVHRVFSRFRAEYRGKASPVHFFWGAFDLATTRFSGRAAPPHPGGIPNCPDRVMREAYSDEVSSCGYWPGGAAEGVFYSYAYPQPDGFPDHPIAPENAYFDEGLGEFVLPYADVRAADDPDALLLQFLHSTFDAARDLARWDPWPT
jgi:Family of unknown function (DUF5996)